MTVNFLQELSPGANSGLVENNSDLSAPPDTALTASTGTSTPSATGTVSAASLIQEGMRHIGATYSSQPGHRTWTSNVDLPPSFDCSGFINYLVTKKNVDTGGHYDISDNQYNISKQAGLSIPVEQAQKTAGALLFKPGAGANGHVVMSLGNGDTLESSGSGKGVQVIKGGAYKSYLTEAALIPGVDYSNQNVDLSQGAGNAAGIVGADDPQNPAGSNDPHRDPAYSLAQVVALTMGIDPNQIDDHMTNWAQAAQVDPKQQTGGDNVDQFLSAVKQHESGGNYQAKYKGPAKSDAAGAYQFLGSTWRSNAKGISNAPTADQASPAEQDAVAKKMATAYLQRYNGDARLAAIAWYGGVGTADKAAKGQNVGAPKGQGSYNAYADKIVQMMQGQK